MWWFSSKLVPLTPDFTFSPPPKCAPLAHIMLMDSQQSNRWLLATYFPFWVCSSRSVTPADSQLRHIRVSRVRSQQMFCFLGFCRSCTNLLWMCFVLMWGAFLEHHSFSFDLSLLSFMAESDSHCTSSSFVSLFSSSSVFSAKFMLVQIVPLWFVAIHLFLLALHVHCCHSHSLF